MTTSRRFTASSNQITHPRDPASDQPIAEILFRDFKTSPDDGAVQMQAVFTIEATAGRMCDSAYPGRIDRRRDIIKLKKILEQLHMKGREIGFCEERLDS